MKKSHFLIAGLSSIAMVGAIASTALLQPSPPSPPSPPSSPPSSAPLNQQPPLPNQNEGQPSSLPSQPPSLPTEELSLPSQETVVDTVANIVIDKFQNANCEELSQMQPSSSNSSAVSSDPQAVMQEQAIAILKQNPEIREQFINQVAPAIANKMFDCNIIP
jgi:hypothetical protein